MTDKINDEWQNYISTSAFKSKYTTASYKNGHKRLTDNLGMPIYQAKAHEIIEAIDDIANNPNTKASLLNVGIIFSAIAERDSEVKKMIKHKLFLKEEINKHRIKTGIEKGLSLPSKPELLQRLKQLYVEERWSDYIILWLIINYNTRNADVNLEIVNSIHATKKDKKKNYLVRRKEDFVFIRNSYKTSKTYGQKKHYFKSQHMSRAVRYFINEQPPDMRIFLFNNNGDKMSEMSLTNKIKSISGGLTEGDINKILVSAIEDVADYSALKQLSDRRGTDVDTLINHYNLKFQAKDMS